MHVFLYVLRKYDSIFVCMYVYVCMYLSVVVLGSTHDLDESDGVHENLAQQKNVETVHTELDAYTYMHTYILLKKENYFTYIHTTLKIVKYIHTLLGHTYIHTCSNTYII